MAVGPSAWPQGCLAALGGVQIQHWAQCRTCLCLPVGLWRGWLVSWPGPPLRPLRARAGWERCCDTGLGSRVGIDSSTLQMVEKWNLKPFFINVLHNTNKVLLSKVLTVHSFALNRLTLLKLLYMVEHKTTYSWVFGLRTWFNDPCNILFKFFSEFFHLFAAWAMFKNCEQRIGALS